MEFLSKFYLQFYLTEPDCILSLYHKQPVLVSLKLLGFIQHGSS